MRHVSNLRTRLSHVDCVQWLRLSWSVFGVALFAATWKLWTPQTDFPQIPFFTCLVSAPVWSDYLLLGMTLVGLIGVCVCTCGKTEYSALFLILFLVGTVSLILLDQHRLQPWALHLCLIAIALLATDRNQSLRLMRWLTISIYIYSAISKFDYQFLHTVGQMFLAKLFSFILIDISGWSADSRLMLAALLPVGELLIGIGLAIDKVRRLFVLLALLMHFSLLLLLGPLGLGHQAGVLVWNAFFMVLILLLFSGARATTKTSSASKAIDTQEIAEQKQRSGMFPDALVTLLMLLAMLFPLGEFFNISDHWPSWDLYSPRSSRAKINLHASAIERLPTAVQAHLHPIEDRDDYQLDLSDWSLDQLHVPIYPEDRFQFAVALAISERYRIDRELEVHLLSASNRFNGQRSQQTIRGHQALQMAARRFRINTRPRAISLP